MKTPKKLSSLTDQTCICAKGYNQNFEIHSQFIPDHPGTCQDSTIKYVMVALLPYHHNHTAV